jgi:alpha-N-acetylglucosamine transferase
MFNKLNIFNMTAYDAVLYLDADTVVIGSISDMFDVYLAEMIRNDVYIGWSADLGNTGNDFYGRNNAGILLVRPSSMMLQDMIHSMNEISFNAGMSEQGFLNAYFQPSTELSIPAETYNCMPANRCFVESKNVSIAHFTIIKPESILWKLRCWYEGIIDMCNAWSQYKRELDTVVDNSRAL